jgi:DNA-directed RNA polymerase specialized sigma subunit
MKAFALVLFALTLSNARAESWVETKCSNSDGTVKWESGVENKDIIHLKYSTFVEGTLSLDVNKVSIQFAKDITLNERSFNTCQTMGKGRVYAAKVKIVAADKHPEVLRNYFPDNKVQTEVICTTIVSEPSDCTTL